MDTTDPRPPLSHLKVLDLTRLFPGAYCTGLLADLGADVVKVEAPGVGDGNRFVEAGPFPATHVAFNRGKRSITLDLKHAGAPEVLRRLAADVDVVVESQRPGLLDGLGIGFEDLRAVNPRLVWCSLTGFGSTGPFATAPGHDLNYLGQAGLLSVLGPDRSDPPLPEAVLAVPLGALTAVAGILAAVAAREHTGVGSRVDAAITDAATWAIQDIVVRAVSAPDQRWGQFASRQIYRCADGRAVTVTASEPRSWRRLCEALALPDLAELELGDQEERKIAALTEAFTRRPAAEWVADPGLAAGVGVVNEPGDLAADPLVVARHGLVPLDDEAGTPVVANPIRFDGADGDGATFARSTPPGLGEHSDEVLAAAGFTEAEIAALHTDGVV